MSLCPQSLSNHPLRSFFLTSLSPWTVVDGVERDFLLISHISNPRTAGTVSISLVLKESIKGSSGGSWKEKEEVEGRNVFLASGFVVSGGNGSCLPEGM